MPDVPSGVVDGNGERGRRRAGGRLRAASQLSATTFDHGKYTAGPQVVIPSGYDALPRLLANGLQIVLAGNTPPPS